MAEPHRCLDEYRKPPDRNGFREWDVKAFPEVGTEHVCACGWRWRVDRLSDGLKVWRLQFPVPGVKS